MRVKIEYEDKKERRIEELIEVDEIRNSNLLGVIKFYGNNYRWFRYFRKSLIKKIEIIDLES